MSATGQATVDFGPYETSAQTIVTGQTGIASGSLVEAWLFPVNTATNFADNHWFDHLHVMAGSVVPGVGFTITVTCREGLSHGAFNVGWVWN